MVDPQDNDDDWYRAGLRFECTKCGDCCTGDAGYVWVSVEEAGRMAEALDLTLDAFGRKYLRRVSERYSLIENPVSGACIFLENNRCQIHELRPSQCRSFPFWASNLRDRASWDEAAKDCEGISPEAPLLDTDTIERLRRG